MPDIDPAWIALIGTLFGGVVLKVTEKWLGKSKDKTEARRDLLAELKELIERVDKLEDEVTQWRLRYYSEQEKRHLLRLQLIQAGEVPADQLEIELTGNVDENASTFTA